MHLAQLFHKKKNIPKSLDYFQQHFDLARLEKALNKNRALIDQARVNLGIAKANANIGKSFCFCFHK